MTQSQHDPPFRALVVDDNPAIHKDFQKILCPPEQPADQQLLQMENELFGSSNREIERQQFELHNAYQGEEAVELVRRADQDKKPFCLAFVDMRMPPGINGTETIRKIWEIDPHVQVIICTAYTDHTWNEIVGTLGKQDGLLVLRKPFDSIEVLQAAHALSSKWVLAAEVREKLERLDSAVRIRTAELEETNQQLLREVEYRSEAEDNLRYMASHDSLTGLPNRTLLQDRITSAIARAHRYDSHFAVMLLDLDHFKDVNDTCGHEAGDALLQVVAERLRRCAREVDTVARMGGDEFIFVLENLNDPKDAALVAQRVIAKCSEPIAVSGHEVRTPPSIGVAVYPADGKDPQNLLKAADLAMYEAKSTGRATFRYYSREMLKSSMEMLQVREELNTAIAEQQMLLWYQPLVDVPSGTICGMEALVRWNHPVLGLVPPLKFIPAAEKSGLIVQLGEWILKTACQRLAEWLKQGMSGLSMSVNVSIRQLQSEGFVSFVENTVAQYGLNPGQLELEITESAAMDNLPRTLKVLKQLNELGVCLAIDDFGAGYSSLTRIKELPIQTLKIDRFFIKDVVSDQRGAAIVRAVVAMAHSLGLTVVAEGVETPEQLEFLRDLKWTGDELPICDRVQGFLLGRPLPSEDATAVLKRSPKKLKALA